MGWSTWSFIRHFPTEEALEAQAEAMQSSGLENHGFEYVNLDDFYYLNPALTVDPYGRWLVNTNSFPDGMAAVANYVHSLGLKFGIYMTPGIPEAAYLLNTPIEGTLYHARDIVTNAAVYEANYNYGNCMLYIDYEKPGAQAFINSWANLFASWGVDYVKLDGVGDWDIADVQAWSQALQQSGRPIHLELSNSLDVNNGSLWQQYANGWRIDGDIECYCSDGGSTPYPLTDWNNVAGRFSDAPYWTRFGSPGGWNDLDSLEIGNATNNGITITECQTAMTLWSICCAPLLLGTDLTRLDTNDLALLLNDRVLQIDQSGSVGAPLTYNTSSQVWRAAEKDGTFAVAFFNLGPMSTNVSITWEQLGFTNGADVQDLWAGSDLGCYSNGYTASVPSHGSALYRVAPVYPAERFLAAAPGNTITGAATINSVTTASGGQEVSSLGNGATLTFNNIVAPAAGTYNVTFSYFDGDSNRVADISVNGGPAIPVTFGSNGSWLTPATLTTALSLESGTNDINISNPSADAPNFDSLVIQSVAPVLPATPDGLIATSGNSQMALSWLTVAGATGYRVEYGSASHVYTATNITTAPVCTSTGLSNGATYYFVVVATNSAGQSANSSEIARLVGAPASPTGLNAVPGNEQVALTWSGSSSATSYNVKRSAGSGGPFQTIGNVVGTRYTDASVTNGTTYSYVVSAVNGGAESADSAPVLVAPAMANGEYIIISQASGLALDDPGGAANAGADQEAYAGTNQQWMIVSVATDKYRISAANGGALSGTSAGSQLEVNSFTGAADQLWTFAPVNSYGDQDYYALCNVGTGQVIDDFNNSTSAGNPIGQWQADGGNNQNWALVPVKPRLSWNNVNGQLQISWPAGCLGWRLQMQTNSLGTDWANVPDSALSNDLDVLTSPNYKSVFFRLIYP